MNIAQQMGACKEHLRGSRWRHPLLNIPIAQRLACGFLIPALLAAIALGSVGMRSQQLLADESSFYQSLVGGYTSLNTANQVLQQMHTNLLGTLNDASKPQTTAETLREDHNALHQLSDRYATILADYLQQNILERSPELSALFSEAGYHSQIDQQSSYSNQTEATWQSYNATQQEVLATLDAGNYAAAHMLELARAEPAYANAIGSLLRLIQFNGTMIPSVDAATDVEENQLNLTTVLAALCILLGIGIVGWLVFSTLVRRLQQTRRIVQAIENGQMEVRLPTVGRDEIASVSGAVNGMLDTIVGLLEETKQQRDELANAEVLKNLHEQLQKKHDALNEANARLAALATTDPLTGLANHQRVMTRIEEELSRCQRIQEPCSLLFIDLDHFKRINDTWGHRAGDMVLHETAQRLLHTLRREDLVGRYGGEEFAIVLSHTGLEEARKVAERVRLALADTLFLWEVEESQKTVPISVTASIGVAISPEHGNSRAALIEAADAAMYQAKHAGRNHVSVAGEEQAFVRELLEQQYSGSQFDPRVASALLNVLENKERSPLPEEDLHRKMGIAMEESPDVQAEPTLAVG